MSSALRGLIEDLRMLLPIAIVGSNPHMHQDSAYHRLLDLCAGLDDNPELDSLAPEELRAVTTFKITVYRAAEMEPRTGRKHIGAVWRGIAKQALMKLPNGRDFKSAVHDLMAGGI